MLCTKIRRSLWTLGEGYDCVNLAKKFHTHLYFAYHAAFNPMTLQTKELIAKTIQAGDKIKSFKVESKEDVRNYHGGNSWIFDPAISGGGCLIDSGINAISIVHNVGIGNIKPTYVKLEYDPQFKVETAAHVHFTSLSDPSVKGELIQLWLHTGTEKREFSVTFQSGKVISFDYTTGFILIKHNGKEEKIAVKIREDTDVHNTPMAYEYINIVNDAIKNFDRKEYIDDIGLGPFITVMEAYNYQKSKL